MTKVICIDARHYKCRGYEINSPNGRDFDCEYRPSFPCDDCKYCAGNFGPGTGSYRGKDPAAKCNHFD